MTHTKILGNIIVLRYVQPVHYKVMFKSENTDCGMPKK